MEFLCLADPLASFRIYKDSTYAMLRELARRGHTLWACTPSELRADGPQVTAQCQRLKLTGASEPWFQVLETARRPLSDFAACLMRKDPPVDLEYLYTTQLLELAERQGARIFNRPAALREHNEKLAILPFTDWIAPTRVSCDPQELRAFISEQGDAILKPLDSMGGDGIFRVRPDDPNLSVILESQTRRGQRTVMVQRYLPEIADGDKRVLLIAGKAVPYALARIPQAGETRGNLAAGGRGEARPLTAREHQIAEALGPELAQRGLLLVGLDVIGGFVTEINVTSPTCFQEITQQTGCDVAALFVDALETQCGSTR